MSNNEIIENIYSLSPMQEGMLFHKLLDKDKNVYFQQMCFKITGGLNLKVFEESMNKIVERYSILRTIFVYENQKKPLQIVLKEARIDIAVEDKSALTTSEKLMYIDEFKKRDIEKGFNLSGEILLRGSLIKIDEEEYIFVFSYHHIILDGWSLTTIFNDLFIIYRSLCDGVPLHMHKVNQYSNYIKWLEEQDKKEALSYWNKYLEGYEQQAQIPQIEKSIEEKEYTNSSIKFSLNKEVTDRLKSIAQKNCVTTNTIFQAVWGILLQRYNNINDVVFGTVVSGRPPEIQGIESMVGLFINAVPVRIKNTEDKSFIELVKKIQASSIESKKYEYVPLSDIQAKTAIKQKLIDSILVFENYPTIKYNNSPGSSENLQLKIDLEEVVQQTNYKFNIIVEVNDTVSVTLLYNSAIYDQLQIDTIMKQIERVLVEVIENPEIKLSEIRMISEEEEKKILVDFNDTKMDYLKDKTIQELFEEQVEKTPDNIAAVYEGKEITYKELNEKVNSVAKALRERGVKPNSLVGIIVERSLEMIIGIMGILKSGGAYLPIDPEYPQDRIEYILNNSNADMLLTQKHIIDRIKFNGVILDIDDAELYKENKGNLSKVNSSRDLAYVIYTSGSTGKPKGVMIEHRNVLNLAVGMNSRITMKEKESILALATFSFDMSIPEILIPLTKGLKIIIASSKQQKDTNELSKLILENNINIAQITPSRIQLLLNSDKGLLSLSNVEKLLVGAEALPQTLFEELKKINIPKLYNMYGPTETTVWSSIKELTNSCNVTLGQPIANTKIYIIGENNKLQPIGVAGEVCISGDGVARGYLNRLELTKEKFIPNPFEKGQMMYRAGDLAKWLPNGELEFVGRIDHQVKIRGFRIEIGEIENQLLNSEEIKEAVVVDREDKQGNKYLCAYIISDREMTVAELRGSLSKKLPDYMMSTYFIRIEKMPLTPNGKIDRKALPEPDGDINTGVKYVAPRNKEEKTLVNIWSDVLSIEKEKIGIDDDFFILGGHSLKAIQVVSIIHRELSVEVPVGKVFSNPTIRQIGEYIGRSKKSIYLSIKVAEEGESHKVGSAQKRIFALNQFNDQDINYNIPAAMLIEGKLEREKIGEIFKKLVDRHEAFRTSFELQNEKIAQRIHKEVELNIEYEEVSDEEEEVLKQIVETFIRPFDLSKAPLLRVKLVRVDKEKHILMVDMHHIVSDGESIEILMKEFIKLYRGEKLEELRIQYKDYAAWQNEILNSEDMKKQEEYWMKVFSGEIPVLDMPTDYQRPTIQSSEGECIRFKIDKELVEKLRRIGKDSGATLYMTLLAAYNILLSKYSGQADIIIGSPIAGRPHADLQGIVGMFVNTLAMRNYPEGRKRFRKFLEDVKANALSAYENQDYQFDKLIEKLDIRRDISRNPMFDTMFSLQSINTRALEVNDFKIKPYEFKNKIAKFDLTLAAREMEEEIVFDLEYCTKLFKKETIERMKEHFVNILREVVKDPEIKICEIDMLSEEEKRRVLVEFNDTYLEYPKDKTFQQLFEEQVKRTPDTVAVVFEDKQLTYAELNAKANKLARTLRKKGIRPDSIVGIMVERSLDMIVGIMAIIKSGGVYLPIDSGYPEERIRYMLKNSEASILITQSHLTNEFDLDCDKIDISNSQYYDSDDSNLECINTSQNLIYVIYTSGTTGNPKGVMVEQMSLINAAFTWRKHYNLDKFEVRLLQMANISFDVFSGDLCRSLLNGGTMYICTNRIKFDLKELYDCLTRNKINIFESTPSLISMFMDYVYQNNLEMNYLKILIMGSDSCPMNEYKKLLERYGNSMRIINSYGITEATIDSGYYEEKIENIPNIVNTPIGKPLHNTQFYILNKSLQLQPTGITGELYIGGDGLARGYFNNADLTKSKFIHNPFKDEERLYKTGDLARWLPDGNIEFLGRMDHQVKIRGFRIEIGEIESQLLKNEEIREVIIMDREDARGSKYLCAYITCAKEITISELRESLSKELPDYMIPAYFMQIEKLPLTPNGKVDRRALLDPAEDIATGEKYVAPRNEMEEKLSKVWSKVLGIERIGIDDDFFTLGGDSIKAIQVSARLCSNNIKMVVSDLFLNPTIRHLSQYTKQTDKQIKQINIEGKIELTAIQEWFFEQNFTNMHHWNQAVMLYSKEGFDESIIRKVFSKLVEHHDALRMVFREEEENVVQYNNSIDNELFDLSLLDFKNKVSYESEIAKEATKIQSSINLSEGPLVKLGLFKTEDGDHLLIVIHHLVVDGISWRVLFEDFATLYRQAIDKQRFELPPKTHSFQEWSDNIKKYAESNELLEEIKYWRDIENTKVGELPKDHEPTNGKGYLSNSMKMSLSREETEKLLRDANKTYNTEINDILLAALGLVIKEWTGESKVLINLEGHGREDILPNLNISRTVGWFTAEYPVILDYEKCDEIGYHIKSVKESLRKIPNKGVGYNILKYITSREYVNDLEFKLNPQISFNYLGQVDNDVNQGGFSISPISAGEAASQESERLYSININGMIVDEKLTLAFQYYQDEYNRDTIKALIENYKQILLDVIKHCIEKEEMEMTPSDFDDEMLSIEELEDIRSIMGSFVDGK